MAARPVRESEDPHSRIGAQLTYWQGALTGMAERLVLPTDRPYPAVADYRGTSLPVEWSAGLLQEQIARVARAHQVTSFMVIQSALAVLLAKLSASADVAVGFPSRAGATRRSMRWSGFSSTRWCCGST